MNSNFELPDSTDWISTSLPAFEPLEAALRCEVCKEFLSNPVLTPCSHTFCSICIRRCIATDGKCPSCRNVCSSDKLLPNLAVREVVMRFQEARPKALEMARVDKEAEAQTTNDKKRKLDDTDIEEAESTRQTRSRRTRSQKASNGEAHEDPIEVPDSDDGDDDFLPDGMAKCPICNQTMKAEQVYNHLDVCPGQSASSGRSTRSRVKPEFPKALQSRRQEPSPPPTRLSQLNYSMMKESALRKKLQDLGIPNWGTKDLLKRRHVEWLNIHNSNCDAHETLRKSKRELLRELTEWENTQGGRADTSENKFMKKNFDGSGHAKSHKSDFDDLIARARRQRGKPRTEEGSPEVAQAEAGGEHGSATDTQDPQPQVEDRQIPVSQVDMPDPPNQAGQEQDTPLHSTAQPYANSDSALAIIQQKVQQANEATTDLPVLRSQASIPENIDPDQGLGIQNPLGTADRKVPMFSVPEQPVRDLDISGGAEPQ